MKIRIQTAQNVEIEYEIAGVGYRLPAALIDLAVFLGYYALIYIFLAASNFNVDLPDWMLWVFLLPPVPLLLYPLLCEIFMRGQTVGKKAMNLKVVRIDGGEPSIGSYMLRWLFWLLEANPFTAIAGLGAISVVSIVSTRLGQRIGDIAAGTTVVRLPKEGEPEGADLQQTIRMHPGYEPLLPEVARLTPADIDTVRRGYRAIESGADDLIGSKIAYRVAEVLGIESHRIGETTGFLRRVLTDWTFFHLHEPPPAPTTEQSEEDEPTPDDPFRPIY